MPSIGQVQFHNSELQRLADSQAERDAQARAQAAGFQTDQQRLNAQQAQERDALMATYQSAQMSQQAGIQAQRDAALIANQQQRDYNQHIYGSAERQQLAGLQAERDQRLAGNQWNAAIQHKDLAAELSQTQLTQSENAERNRVREAIADTKRNSYLSDEEKAMMITRLQTKLNPLDARAQQANILQSQVQTQGMHQQIEQRATLFNQHQNWLAQGAQASLVSLTDPATGDISHFTRGSDGQLTPVDFSRNRINEETHTLNMVRGLQGVQQSQTRFPVEMTAANLANTNLQYRNEFLRQATPDQLSILRSQAAAAMDSLATNRQLAPWQVATARANYEHIMNAIDDNLATRPGRIANTAASTASMEGQTADLHATHNDRVNAMQATTRLNSLRGDELRNELALNTTPIDDRQSIVWDPASRAAATTATDNWIRNQPEDVQNSITPEIRQHYINTHLQGNGHGTVVISGANGRFTAVRQHSPPEVTPQQRAQIIGRATSSVNGQFREWQTALAAWNRSTTPVAQRGPRPTPPAWVGTVNADGVPVDSHGLPLDNHALGLLRNAAVQEETNRRLAQPQGQGWGGADDESGGGGSSSPNAVNPNAVNPNPGLQDFIDDGFGAVPAPAAPAQHSGPLLGSSLTPYVGTIPGITGPTTPLADPPQWGVASLLRGTGVPGTQGPSGPAPTAPPATPPTNYADLERSLNEYWNASSMTSRLGSSQVHFIGEMHDIIEQANSANRPPTTEERRQYVAAWIRAGRPPAFQLP